MFVVLVTFFLCMLKIGKHWIPFVRPFLKPLSDPRDLQSTREMVQGRRARLQDCGALSTGHILAPDGLRDLWQGNFLPCCFFILDR